MNRCLFSLDLSDSEFIYDKTHPLQLSLITPPFIPLIRFFQQKSLGHLIDWDFHDEAQGPKNWEICKRPVAKAGQFVQPKTTTIDHRMLKEICLKCVTQTSQEVVIFDFLEIWVSLSWRVYCCIPHIQLITQITPESQKGVSGIGSLKHSRKGCNTAAL